MYFLSGPMTQKQHFYIEDRFNSEECFVKNDGIIQTPDENVVNSLQANLIGDLPAEKKQLCLPMFIHGHTRLHVWNQGNNHEQHISSILALWCVVGTRFLSRLGGSTLATSHNSSGESQQVACPLSLQSKSPNRLYIPLFDFVYLGDLCANIIKYMYLY